MKRVWLKAARKSRMLRQYEVATQCSISPASYCNIEKGTRRPSVDVAKRIAAVLGVEWTRFYAEEENERLSGYPMADIATYQPIRTDIGL